MAARGYLTLGGLVRHGCELNLGQGTGDEGGGVWALGVGVHVVAVDVLHHLHRVGHSTALVLMHAGV